LLSASSRKSRLFLPGEGGTSSVDFLLELERRPEEEPMQKNLTCQNQGHGQSTNLIRRQYFLLKSTKKRGQVCKVQKKSEVLRICFLSAGKLKNGE
jgi:hypothetical protein